MKSGPKPRSPEERFDEIVVKEDGGCWLWGGRDSGKRYGQILMPHGKAIAAHRFSYMRYKGDIPRGMVVRHKCDVMRCCNPDHLELGTHEDNNQDRVDRGRTRLNLKARKDRKVRRHGQFKLRREEIERVKQEYATGRWTQAQLAHRWSVSQATISATIRGVHNCSIGLPPKPRTGNFRSKTTETQRQEIRDRYATGTETQAALALEYGVTQARVSDIITGRDKRRSKTIPLQREAIP